MRLVQWTREPVESADPGPRPSNEVPSLGSYSRFTTAAQEGPTETRPRYIDAHHSLVKFAKQH